jgi:hypothetical protein
MHSIMAGALYVLGTVAGVLSVVVVGGFPDESFLDRVAANPTVGLLGALLVLMMGLSLASMTLFLYPLFRRDSEPLALGMVVFRGTLEGAWYLMTALSWVAIVVVSAQLGQNAGAAASLRMAGQVIVESSDRLGDIGSIVFLIGASCLYASFYRTKLIPRWLSTWGLVGAIPYLAHYLMRFFGVESSDLLYMPLAIQEMVMGGWLIVAGFNKEAVRRLGQAETASSMVARSQS